MEEQDVKLRISSGSRVNVRANAVVAKLFPDGCKFEHRLTPGGHEIVMRNRAGGRKFTYVERDKSYIVVLDKMEGQPLPRFGAVSPEQVTSIKAGLLVTLPENLPAPQPVGRPSRAAVAARNAAKAAKPSQEPAAAPAIAASQPAAPATPPSPAQPEVSVVPPAPSIPLPEAIAAVNGWKHLLGEHMVLELTAAGTVRVTVEYE